MKTFASLLLAAAVSANYCYTDDCNCSGERRECYPLPRQNMRPRAIPTCCPEGVRPTIYGIPNNRAAAQTASLRRKRSVQCQKIETSMTVTGQDGTTCFNFEGAGNTLTLAPASPDMTFSVYLSGTNNLVKLGNGVAAVNLDVLKVKGNMNTAQLTPESMIGKVSMKGSNVHIVGNPAYCKAGKIQGVPRTFDATPSTAACGVTSNLHGFILADEQTSILRKQCAVAYKNRNCNHIKSASARKNCEKDAADIRKECEKSSADERKESEKAAADERKESEKAAADERKESEKAAANERKESEKAAADARKEYEKNKWTSNLTGSTSATWSPTSKLDNFVDCRDYTLYCCQEWNRFEWECLSQGLPAADDHCPSVVSAASAAGITADRPGTCAVATSSLAMCEGCSDGFYLPRGFNYSGY